MLCHYGNRAAAPIAIIPMLPTALYVLFSVCSVTVPVEEIDEVVPTPHVETFEMV